MDERFDLPDFEVSTTCTVDLAEGEVCHVRPHLHCCSKCLLLLILCIIVVAKKKQL